MALTRKMLKAMGIDDEKIDQIIEAHTETVDALKDERDKYREDAEKLPDVQKKLDTALKASSGDESFEAKYNALKKDFEEYKGEVTAKEIKGAKVTALKGLLKKVGISEKCIDIAVKATNLDDIKLDKDGKIAEPDTVEKSVREELGALIVTEGEMKPTPETPPQTTPLKMSKSDIFKIEDRDDQIKAIAANIDQF